MTDQIDPLLNNSNKGRTLVFMLKRFRTATRTYPAGQIVEMNTVDATVLINSNQALDMFSMDSIKATRLVDNVTPSILIPQSADLMYTFDSIKSSSIPGGGLNVLNTNSGGNYKLTFTGTVTLARNVVLDFAINGTPIAKGPVVVTAAMTAAQVAAAVTTAIGTDPRWVISNPSTNVVNIIGATTNVVTKLEATLIP